MSEKKTPVSFRMPSDYIEAIRTQSTTPGEGLNNILDDYREPTQIARAVHDHLMEPIVSAAEVRQTTFWTDPRRVRALREYAARTYIPFEALMRIMVQDFLKHHSTTPHQT